MAESMRRGEGLKAGWGLIGGEFVVGGDNDAFSRTRTVVNGGPPFKETGLVTTLGGEALTLGLGTFGTGGGGV